MGNEYVLPKSRNYSYEDDPNNRVRNNFQALSFHSVHGDNIKLSKNSKVAIRAEGFCKGIVFSARPVSVREHIYIKFLEIASNWSGALRIGFTMNDPAIKSKLPRYACPDLTSEQGNWAKAIAERLAKKNSVLFYYVDPNGDVHYGVDSEEYGVFFGGVNTSRKLWAVLDIYGNTVAVEFVDHRTLHQDNQNELSNNPNPVLRNDASSRGLVSPDAAAALGNMMLTPLYFHRVHGCNVTLKKNGAVASRKPNFLNCYVFTERPVRLEEKVVLQIRQSDTSCQGTLIYGVTSCNPSTLNPYDLPDNADDLVDRPEYWVFNTESEAFHNGDVVILSISAEGKVEVKKNNGPLSTAFHVDHTQSLWLFIDLHASISEITLLGLTDSCFSSIDERMKQILDLKSLPTSDNRFNKEHAGPSSQTSPGSNSECVICCEKRVNCALYRCGHMCMCHECAMKYWKPDSKAQCPICRNEIIDVIKTYQ